MVGASNGTTTGLSEGNFTSNNNKTSGKSGVTHQQQIINATNTGQSFPWSETSTQKKVLAPTISILGHDQEVYYDTEQNGNIITVTIVTDDITHMKSQRIIQDITTVITHYPDHDIVDISTIETWTEETWDEVDRSISIEDYAV